MNRHGAPRLFAPMDNTDTKGIEDDMDRIRTRQAELEKERDSNQR